MKRPTDQQKTDTQFFFAPEDGFGSFHWRWIFPVKIPCNIPKLLVQVWDFELLSPNDAICEANIQLKGFFTAAEKKGTKNAADLDLAMTHPNYKGEQGKIALSLELMPQAEADDDPVEESSGFGLAMSSRLPELATREGMYDFYRPPLPIPNFYAIFIAQLKAKAKTCAICCGITCVIALALVVVMASDMQLKTGIETIPNSQYEMIGLRGVTWEWNDLAKESLGLHGKSHGVLAQEVESLYPWLVVQWPWTDGYKRVNYLLLDFMVMFARICSLMQLSS